MSVKSCKCHLATRTDGPRLSDHLGMALALLLFGCMVSAVVGPWALGVAYLFGWV
jgi:hypothetical protein